MRFVQLIDLTILILASAGVAWVFPFLGVALFILNVLFATQYWKTLLLLGSEVSAPSTSKKVKAAVLALMFSVIAGLALNDEGAVAQNESFMNLWNHDFFPALLAISILASLLMAALITEKRKR